MVKRNLIARAVRTPKFRMRVIPNKKKPKRQSKHQKAMKSKWLE